MDSRSSRWSADSSLLYYFALPQDEFIPDKVMAVPIGQEAEPTFGEPFVAFELDDRFNWFGQGFWDISDDGRLLAIIETQPYVPPTQINVVTNWFEKLKDLVPTER